VSLPTTIPLLGWTWNDLLFLTLGAVLIGTALMVVLGRNIIRSGLWLILCFATLAGLYVLLGNPLVAVAQVLVYMGAIAVLILFAIMLTQTKAGSAALVFHHQAWAAAIAALLLGGILAMVGSVTGWPLVGPFMATDTRHVAELIFSDFLLAFEIVGVLLLAAVIGGVFLAKREDDRPEPKE
jgi:NADH-quinone oxidoreductase subunit J